ncbi:regulatory particle non-ATPase [Tilletia horrida]|uniref:Regulatory particle non-ATPase n=1 Tax=Tilletia horrida TaxID=155126 RepID=A0AAN6JLH3_9BASI|nr:regulatory particle non-ATPase [Tilletia horrida]KAK0563924.1 regulatory particle non-ATPase [Tilletia horrida]
MAASSSSSASLQASHDELLRLFSTASSPAQLGPCGAQLAKLKIELTKAGLLVPLASRQTQYSPEQLVLARDVLEVGAFYSVRVADVKGFDRYMDLLKTFYSDFATTLPPSENHHPLLGLSLLRLLASNQISSFHTALETLPPDVVQSSPYVQHPVNLERWLMEGSYSKVWSARQEAPRVEYQFFVDQLMGTIRHEIASCEEKAYDSLPLRDAATLLFFNNMNDVLAFAKERGWNVEPSTQTINFANKADASRIGIGARDSAAKKETIKLNLHFAKELESIV